MTKDKKTIGLVAGLAVITIAVILLIIAKPFSSNTKSDGEKDVQTEPIDSNYIAVNPSFGPLIVTVNLPVTFEEEQATGFIPNNKPENNDQRISVGQDVVLYDRNDFPQPLGGKVSKINNQEEQVQIVVDLPKGTDTSLLSPYVDIITLETKASKRLPKTAIMRDENDQAFVWRAFPDFEFEDAYKLSRLDINVGRGDQDFFEEAGFKIKSDDLVIVNPNDEIKAEVAYTLNVSELNAYLHNPIRQAWITLELDRLEEQQIRMIREAEECAARAQIANADQEPQLGSQTTTNSNQSSSCAGGAVFEDYEGTDPFLIFQNLIHEFQQKENDLP